MKKYILTCVTCCLLTINGVMAQSPKWIWAEGSTSVNSDYGIGISVDLNGNLFLGGVTQGLTLGGASSTGLQAQPAPFSGKLDTSGKGYWYSALINSPLYRPYGFYRDNNNNTYLDGIINSQDGMFITKFNSSGTVLWMDTIGESDIIGFGITADAQGHVYVTGSFDNGYVKLGSTTLSYPGNSSAIFIAKLDVNGKFIWAKSAYGTGQNDGSDRGDAVVVDNTGSNIYVAGAYEGVPSFDTIKAPNTGGLNLFIAKYDSSGDALKVITANSAGISDINGGVTHLALDACNNIYVTGNFEGTALFDDITLTAKGQNDIYVAKCDNNGAWQWVEDIGGIQTDYGSNLALDRDNDIYVCGNITTPATIDATNIPSGNAFVAKFSNSNGALQWVHTASSGGADGLGAITVDNAKYAYVTGMITFTATFDTFTMNGDYGSVVVAKLDTLPMPTISPAFNAPFCGGDNTTLTYTENGTFNPGNVFTAQLSDSTGSFAHAVNIGTVTATGNGTINISIPPSTPQGKNYLIRVVSSNPAVSSYATCNNYFTINDCLGVPVLPANNNAVSVYPNPGSGAVNVTALQNIDAVKVTNLVGQIVYEATPEQPAIHFNLKDEGTYFITLTFGSQTITKKLTVSK